MVSLRHDLILFRLKILSVWVFRAALDNETVQHETGSSDFIIISHAQKKIRNRPTTMKGEKRKHKYKSVFKN